MTNKIKYPRTYHLPWTDSAAGDDKILPDVNHFIGKEVVVTEKMDGENTTMYNDYIHARSIDSRNHVSRDWVKQFWSSIRHNIPDGWRICGENLYAQHSIVYNDLPSYFMAFSVWDEDISLSWDDTVLVLNDLGIIHVPVLYRGPFNESLIKHIGDNLNHERQEGYVVRVADSFSYNNFSKNVAKYVRKNHVGTDVHWMQSEIKKNGIIV